MKYKWKVSNIPQGRYRSFEKRDWPHAFYDNKDESPCAYIYCDDEYLPRNIKTGNHDVLTLRVADYSKKPFVWRTVTKTYGTLKEAKEGLKIILKKYPEIIPKED